MIVTDSSEEKSSVHVKSPQHPPSHPAQPNEERPPPDQSAPSRSPPPYTLFPQGPSVRLQPAKPLNIPVGLPPGNHIHIMEKNGAVKEKVLLDLSLPPPPASALPPGAPSEDIPHLTLESHNGSVSGEVWVLRAKQVGASPAPGVVPKPARERVRLHFRSHNGSIKADVHVHPATVEPRPFFSIEARTLNGSVMLTVPRSFRGQLTLHTNSGRVHLSSALALHAATLSTLNGTHTYFVGERPRSGTWDDGTNGDGEPVDVVMGSTKNGTVKVTYDDETVFGTKGPGVLSSLFKAIGF
ncbi:hypothetical protein BC827DRAFT_1267153 [Russula dissimulans]|nr:hypothetical protein BC827DRAFT_1267153 [Russula dissimulans]